MNVGSGNKCVLCYVPVVQLQIEIFRLTMDNSYGFEYIILYSRVFFPDFEHISWHLDYTRLWKSQDHK